MTKRLILVVLGLAGAVLAPATAFARDGGTAGIAKKLSDPGTQAAAAAALAAMAEKILDIDIGGYARAIDAAGGGSAVRDLPPDPKLRDLAGPDAERMPRTIARNVPKAMGSAAKMAGAMDDLKPQLRETMRQLKDAIPRY
jgi:hypothetical protein